MAAARQRDCVSQHLDVPTLNDHLPTLLEELAEALESRSDETIAEALRDGSPLDHGLQRVQDGFDIVEVVAEYNILRGCVHDLAEANGFSLQGQAFHILNRVLDGAIGYAVESFATERALEVRHRREEYLAFVAHDLRTRSTRCRWPRGCWIRRFRPRAETPKARAWSSRCTATCGTSRRWSAKVLEENTNLETEIGIKLERRSFDLWPLVEALVHDINPVAGTGSTQLINMVPEDLVVFADASLLRRIFQNLIANAIVYTPRGEVRIGAEPGAAEGAVDCWVSDNGAGIPAELLDKVFEKGAGDPEKDGSTGLGLAIVKTFLEAHGGTARAESELGRGTTVRFDLPAKSRNSTLRKSRN